MIDPKKVDFAQLKQAVKTFNDCGVLEELKMKPIRAIGVKKPDIIDAFKKAVDKVAEKELDEMLPDEAAILYNSFFEDEMTEDQKKELLNEETKETDSKEEADSKKESPKKESKDETEKAKEPPIKKGKTRTSSKAKKTENKDVEPKKERKGRGEKSVFGHMLSSDTGLMDGMFQEGTTFAQLIEVLGVEKTAISRHIRRLRKKGYIITKKNDDADAMSVIYKVKAPTKK